MQAELKSVYGTVDKVDLWVGGLAENHVNGGSMGQTFTKIIADQFQRLRDGDRFFYMNQFHGAQLAAIQNTTLADIIARDSGTTNLQDNVFFFKTSISGRVTSAIAQTLSPDSIARRPGSGSTGLSGIKIELLDADGNVVATTTTDRNGAYQFSQVDLGSYTVRETGATGTVQELTVSLTKGEAMTAIDFVESTVSTPVTPNPGPRPGRNFPGRVRR